jgi:hypothetical protein
MWTAKYNLAATPNKLGAFDATRANQIAEQRVINKMDNFSQAKSP